MRDAKAPRKPFFVFSLAASRLGEKTLATFEQAQDDSALALDAEFVPVLAQGWLQGGIFVHLAFNVNQAAGLAAWGISQCIQRPALQALAERGIEETDVKGLLAALEPLQAVELFDMDTLAAGP